MSSIAIDGPAGAGKSTVAKMVASRLGSVYVDTGAMYRAMALHVVEKGADINDASAVAKAAESAVITIERKNGEQRVILGGTDVTGELRTERVSSAASVVSVVPEVRAKLVALQRELAEKEDVVMDGRDIGTVVLPNAALKIFLTADAGVRAHRRYLELMEKGEEADEEQILRDIKERDERDMTRAESPLKKADDAVAVDSSYISAEEVADRILELWREKSDRLFPRLCTGCAGCILWCT